MNIDAMFELPTREQFQTWLEGLVAASDERKREMNAGSHCYLTEFFRATGEKEMTVCIDVVYRDSKTLCHTPTWMFNFQCNALYQNWRVKSVDSGHRYLNEDRIRIADTAFTPAEALAILKRTSDVA